MWKLRSAVHVGRMDDFEIPKIFIITEVIYGRRRVGRLERRWLNGVKLEA